MARYAPIMTSLLQPPRTSRWRNAADRIEPPTRALAKDPVRWAAERGLHLWSKQCEIVESVRDNSQTAVHSCHEVGKSFVAACTACWWIDVHPPGEAFVVTTAPTDKQVRAVLWREINRLHTKLGLAGRTNLTEWYIGKEMVAFGRKPADHDPSAFQGVHARFMLVILDEAGGIPKELWDAASTLGANVHARVLAIGNPDDPVGEFADNCKPSSGWEVLQIGYEDTPNFTGEPIPADLAEMLISREWVAGRELKWGRNSALFMSKCLGKFPTGSSPWIVVPLPYAEKCRWLEFLLDGLAPVEAGIDVGAGSDRTVMWSRQGTRLLDQFVFVDSDPMKSVGALVQKINEWGVKRVKIDPIGVGWALSGRLRELSRVQNPQNPEACHDAEIIGVNFAESPTAGKEGLYLNKRAEVWWEVGRERSRLGTWCLDGIDDDTLQELTTPKYEILDSKGKIKIQPKEEVRKELGRSPDSADALLLAFYDATSVAVITAPHSIADYDLSRGLDPAASMGTPLPF